MAGVQASGGWHILGAGAMGQLFAHSLRRIGVDVTLVLRSTEAVRHFEDADRAITLTRRSRVPAPGAENNDKSHSEAFTTPSVSRGYRAEVTGSESGDTIQNLIVTLKAHQTVGALRQLHPRLCATTNVFLLQNGLGVYDALCDEVFKNCDPWRPRFFMGVTTHGCTRTPAAPFTVRHNTVPGEGEVHIGFASSEQEQTVGGSDTVANSLSVLKKLSDLNVSTISNVELLAKQETKLLVNCCINPIATLLGCRNGELLESDYAKFLMKEVCRECVAVLNSSLGRPRSATALGVEASLSGVYQVARQTASNTCSMLQDMQAGRETEIDFLNGYIVSRAAETSVVQTPVNLTLLRLVKAKTAMMAFAASN